MGNSPSSCLRQQPRVWNAKQLPRRPRVDQRREAAPLAASAKQSPGDSTGSKIAGTTRRNRHKRSHLSLQSSVGCRKGRQDPPCRPECSKAPGSGSVKAGPTGPAEGGPAGTALTGSDRGATRSFACGPGHSSASSWASRSIRCSVEGWESSVSQRKGTGRSCSSAC